MDISATVKGTDYLMLESNLIVESVIDLDSAKKKTRVVWHLQRVVVSGLILSTMP